MSGLDSLANVFLDCVVGSDGGGSGSSPLSDSNSSSDLGETVVVGGSEPVGSGNLSAVKGLSSVVSPFKLSVVFFDEVSVGSSNSVGPDFAHVHGMSPHFQSVGSLVSSNMHVVDGFL